jgi:hypothetical protein
MVAVYHVEARSDQNDLQNKTMLHPVQQCISKHGAWLTGELEEDLDSSRYILVFGSMRANGDPSNIPDSMPERIEQLIPNRVHWNEYSFGNLAE